MSQQRTTVPYAPEKVITPAEDAQPTPDEVFDCIQAVAVHTKERINDRDLLRAQDQFFSATQIDWEVARQAPESAEYVSMMFSEWLLFEAAVGGRRTPLEAFVEDVAAHKLEGWQVAALTEVVRTQMFSQFRITNQDPQHGRCVLEDLHDGAELDLRDGRLSGIPHYATGSMAVRVAHVGACWYVVGQTYLHDNLEVGQTAIVPPLAYDQGRCSVMLGILRRLFGENPLYTIRGVRHFDEGR